MQLQVHTLHGCQQGAIQCKSSDASCSFPPFIFAFFLCMLHGPSSLASNRKHSYKFFLNCNAAKWMPDLLLHFGHILSCQQSALGVLWSAQLFHVNNSRFYMNFLNKHLDLGLHLSQSTLGTFLNLILSIWISTLSKYLQPTAIAVAPVLKHSFC